MTKLFIIISILWTLTNTLTPKEFDFKNKTLQKELLKINENNIQWEEIILPDSIIKHNTIQGKFFVLNDTKIKKYIYVGRVNSCRQGGCENISKFLTIETPEYFEYLIEFNSNISVTQVKVYNYQATHGQEITNKGWLKQFQGFNENKQLTVGKNIDAISGATVSVFGITNDIQEKTKLLKILIYTKTP